jgi:hypothetical protein
MEKEIIIKNSELYTKKVSLKKIKVDNINWVVYYLDEETKEKWVEEYPGAEYHGGGSPQLRRIEKFPW